MDMDEMRKRMVKQEHEQMVIRAEWIAEGYPFVLNDTGPHPSFSVEGVTFEFWHQGFHHDDNPHAPDNDPRPHVTDFIPVFTCPRHGRARRMFNWQMGGRWNKEGRDSAMASLIKTAASAKVVHCDECYSEGSVLMGGSMNATASGPYLRRLKPGIPA